VCAEIAGTAAELLFVYCVLLAFGNLDLDSGVICRRAEARAFEAGTARANHRVRLVEGAPHLERYGSVVLVQMPDDSDPQSADVAGQRGPVFRGRVVSAGGVLRV